MQYCERVTGAATWHQIPLLEHNPAAESCAGDGSSVGLRTVRVNDGGSAARPGPSALPLSLHFPPCSVTCHFGVSLFLYTVEKETVSLLLPKALLQPKHVRGVNSL